MHLKSKADPIDVLVIKQNSGTTSGPVSLMSQCLFTNTMTSAYSNTTAGILEGETVGHLQKCNINRTVNLGMSTVSRSAETEVTSAIGGSIVTPMVAHQISDQTTPDLLTSNEMSEISQDDGKFM